MYPFFETIKFENAKVLNVEFHQNRINETFIKFYPKKQSFNLKNEFQKINIEAISKPQMAKINFHYNEDSFLFRFSNYFPKIHNDFIFIDIEDNFYAYKFSKRDVFQKFTQNLNGAEPIFLHNKNITDTTYSNLIFQKNNRWYTPKTFLLNGTKRQFYLQNKKIIEADITVDNYKTFSHFALINAMLDIENTPKYPIELIQKMKEL